MHRRAGFGSVLVLVLAALALFLLGGQSLVGARQASPVAGATPPSGLPGVTSDVLGRGLPPAAPGQELAIGRVTIAPGASIPTHEHPGTQVAAIVGGELTYTVLTREVALTRAGGPTAGTPAATEAILAGETVILRAGDSVVEQVGAIHMARNEGTEPVVILVSTLFETGEPRTIFVSATPVP